MSDIAMIVGERIQAYRKKVDMTQERLAEKSGIHHTYIGQLERGEKNATLETIEKVARALELPFETLFEAIIIADAGNTTAKEVYQLIATQPEKDQQFFQEIIKKVLEYKDTKAK